MRANTNSDYQAHSAPFVAKSDMLDILKVNTVQIAVSK